MTDLELKKLCAEALWGPDKVRSPTTGTDKNCCYFFNGFDFGAEYDPLNDDAQAMALVKKFQLNVNWCGDWEVTPQGAGSGESLDLNRAICECVAKMQAAEDGK